MISLYRLLAFLLAYQWPPQWKLEANLRAPKVDIGNRDGTFRRLEVELDFSVADNFLAGISLISKSFDAVSQSKELTGRADWSYEGADIFLYTDISQNIF